VLSALGQALLGALLDAVGLGEPFLGGLRELAPAALVKPATGPGDVSVGAIKAGGRRRAIGVLADLTQPCPEPALLGDGPERVPGLVVKAWVLDGFVDVLGGPAALMGC
jgi:hypothetical protein